MRVVYIGILVKRSHQTRQPLSGQQDTIGRSGGMRTANRDKDRGEGFFGGAGRGGGIAICVTAVGEGADGSATGGGGYVCKGGGCSRQVLLPRATAAPGAVLRM